MSHKEELEVHRSPDHKQQSRLSTCSLEINDILRSYKTKYLLFYNTMFMLF